ncbi:hypothetical protein [Bosea sp. RAC05]|uniref:hypothetical protein n=1 Tax=Bosea sp. RAC05 TaxID=1842539 RepID=UPI00083D27B3|nr:hypothetical protein [Bosea sp. RAC05]AOG02827.1 hypothetical protein BSY19_5327 [Bosea sp. RAC05]
MTVAVPTPHVAQSLHKAIAALAAFKSGLQPPQSSWPARLAAAVVALDRLEASPVPHLASGLGLDMPFHVLSKRAGSIIKMIDELTGVTHSQLLTLPLADVVSMRDRCDQASTLMQSFRATQEQAFRQGFELEVVAQSYAELTPQEDEADFPSVLARVEAGCIQGFALHGAACALLAELGIGPHPADTLSSMKALADCLIDTIDLKDVQPGLVENLDETESLARSVARILTAGDELDADFGLNWRNQSSKRLNAAAAILRGADPSRLASVKTFCRGVCPSEDPDTLERMGRIVDAWARMKASQRGKAHYGSAWEVPDDVLALSEAAAGWARAARRHDPALVARLMTVSATKREQCQAMAADVIGCQYGAGSAVSLAALPDHLDACLAVARDAAKALKHVPISLARECAEALGHRGTSRLLLKGCPLGTDVDPAVLATECRLVVAAHDAIGADLVSSAEARADAAVFSKLVLTAADEIAPLPDAFLPGELATAREIRRTLSTRMAAHHAARDPEKLRGLVSELGGGALLQRLEAELEPAAWGEEAGKILNLAA